VSAQQHLWSAPIPLLAHHTLARAAPVAVAVEAETDQTQAVPKGWVSVVVCVAKEELLQVHKEP
jgi:hypothetical protein